MEKIDEAVCLYEISEGIRLTYARSAFYRMLGLDPDALSLPCELKDIGIHDDYAAEYELLLHAEASDSTGREHVHRIRDSRGDWIWRHTRISRISVSGGVSPVLLEISRDITASMKTGAQLQESLERFQVAFGQSHSRLWEVTLSDRIFRIYPQRVGRARVVAAVFPDVDPVHFSIDERGLEQAAHIADQKTDNTNHDCSPFRSLMMNFRGVP